MAKEQPSNDISPHRPLHSSHLAPTMGWADEDKAFQFGSKLALGRNLAWFCTVKAGIAYKHKLDSGKVQTKGRNEFGRRALMTCHKVLSIWHLSLAWLLTVFTGNTKQRKVVIIIDGRTHIHRGLDRAEAVAKPNKMKFNRINPSPHLSLKYSNCMTSGQEVEGSGLAATCIKNVTGVWSTVC